jgi:hypothetical protein
MRKNTKLIRLSVELSHQKIEMGQFVQYLLREYTYALLTRRSLRVISHFRNYELL